jgi:putative ABC transport system substrate-binding protein
MTDRRQWLTALAATLAATALPSLAQPQRPLPRIAYLSTGSAESNGTLLEALKSALRELGYVDGRNIRIDAAWVGPYANRFPQVAASMVESKPTVLLGTCIPSARAAKNATSTIPVLMAVDGDPVAAGLVASLAHPGGNVTGTATLFEALIPKWIELITTAVPAAREIAVLSDPDNVVDAFMWAKTQAAAERKGVRVLQFGARRLAELEPAFAAMADKGVDALVVLTEAFITSQLARIVPLTERQRLPAIFGYREFAEAGGLMSYGVSYREYYKRVARYVDLVLKGRQPADLPVELPTKIELTVNAAAARRLGLTLPPQLLARADRVVE